MELIEHITFEGQSLCYIIKAALVPTKPTFFTPNECKLQVGYIVYPKGHEIPRHVHKKLERHLIGTSEVVVVRQGCCDVDVYNENRQLVATRELGVGDVLVMTGGGHGFRMKEDTVLFEVKQGPYPGVDEKERF